MIVGREDADSAGIDRKAADKLHRRVHEATGRKRYVITAAQNATPINKPFFETLIAYCRDRRAQLIVIPYRYKNPTSMWSEGAKDDDWWASELVPYLLDKRTRLNPNLIVLADIKTQPTASAPLAGYETITASDSAIVGHPKIELRAVPTPQAILPKLMVTTGAVTQRNYLPGKAGKKGEHHHSFGACVVELDGKRFHLRQINAVSDGSFCDLDQEYRGTRKRKIRISALVMGDTHQEFVDPDVVRATFEGRDSMVATLRPRTLVWHDVHDFYSRNHHHRGEVFINYVKHQTGRDNVERAIDGTFAFIDRMTPAGVRNVFVPSNHPDALTRWIKETDPRSDPENSEFWAETFLVMCRNARWGKQGARTIDPFIHWAKKKLKCAERCDFPARDQSYMIEGIDCGYHGDRGPNGARGTLNAFAKIGVKTVIGHGHSPGINGGAYQLGTSSFLDLEYVSGPSSWLHTHCFIYPNGKRTLVHIIGGEWRA